jgi:hypothetical protein
MSSARSRPRPDPSVAPAPTRSERAADVGPVLVQAECAERALALSRLTGGHGGPLASCYPAVRLACQVARSRAGTIVSLDHGAPAPLRYWLGIVGLMQVEARGRRRRLGRRSPLPPLPTICWRRSGGGWGSGNL